MQGRVRYSRIERRPDSTHAESEVTQFLEFLSIV